MSLGKHEIELMHEACFQHAHALSSAPSGIMHSTISCSELSCRCNSKTSHHVAEANSDQVIDRKPKADFCSCQVPRNVPQDVRHITATGLLCSLQSSIGLVKVGSGSSGFFRSLALSLPLPALELPGAYHENPKRRGK